MSGILFYSLYDDAEAWRGLLAKHLPEWSFNKWPAVENPDDIEVALVWKPPYGELKKYHNLRLIINLGAGVDSLLADNTLPAGVPIVRLNDRGMAVMMLQYVLFFVLNYHRNFPELMIAQQQRRWHYIHPRPSQHTRVGILGLGVLGAYVATELQQQGFTVSGWSRSQKLIEGVETYQGVSPPPAWLATLDILVVLLPLTPKTRGLVDRALLCALPRGAKIISAGRGAVLNELDLLDALRGGQISAATLDTFIEEPLPSYHPFWSMPNVTITPHLASVAVPETCIEQIKADIESVKMGRLPHNAIDPAVGY